MSESDEYSKLDYPKVSCPLQMPGFSNYLISTDDEAEEPVTRKYYIENVNIKDVTNIDVVVGEEKPKDES